jgi:hypothetical protein
MAILFKAVATGTGAATATTASLGAASIGDLVVVATGSPQAGAGAPALPSDNAGNTYIKIAGRNDGTAGMAMFYSFLTIANAGLTVTYTPPAGPSTVVAHLLSGAGAYNADKADSAEFTGSTAFICGPTTLTPPANSIAFYCIGASVTETATPNATGYNTTGVNGFTAGMNTTMHQENSGASFVPTITAYKITSTTESVAVTLPSSAKWFGVIASFAPTAVAGTQSRMRRRRR